MLTYKLCRVHWHDACVITEWKSSDEIKAFCEEEPVLVHSVGWLVADEDTHIVIAQSISSHKADNLLKIPKSLIREMFVMRDEDVDYDAQATSQKP